MISQDADSTSLFYHRGPNFGDRLNEILLPELCRPHQPRLRPVIGIGTIIGHAERSLGSQPAIVFTSGVSPDRPSTYGTTTSIPPSWEVVGVRGTLTAEHLGLTRRHAVGDGSYLLAAEKGRFQTKNGPPRGSRSVVFIPHIGTHEAPTRWPAVCDELGITYVSPSDPPLRTLSSIADASLVIAEALHGALVADAFRVPWVAVRTTRTVARFKWRDAFSTLGIQPRFHYLPALRSSRWQAELWSHRARALGPRISRATLRSERAFDQLKAQEYRVSRVLMSRLAECGGQLSAPGASRDVFERLVQARSTLFERVGIARQ